MIRQRDRRQYELLQFASWNRNKSCKGCRKRWIDKTTCFARGEIKSKAKVRKETKTKGKKTLDNIKIRKQGGALQLFFSVQTAICQHPSPHPLFHIDHIRSRTRDRHVTSIQNNIECHHVPGKEKQRAARGPQERKIKKNKHCKRKVKTQKLKKGRAPSALFPLFPPSYPSNSNRNVPRHPESSRLKTRKVD